MPFSIHQTITIRRSHPLLHINTHSKETAEGNAVPALTRYIDAELLENLFTPLCQLGTSFFFLVQLSLPLTGVLLAASSVYILSVVAKIFVVAWLRYRACTPFVRICVLHLRAIFSECALLLCVGA